VVEYDENMLWISISKINCNYSSIGEQLNDGRRGRLQRRWWTIHQLDSALNGLVNTITQLPVLSNEDNAFQVLEGQVGAALRLNKPGTRKEALSR
jgi:hypothetical protein